MKRSAFFCWDDLCENSHADRSRRQQKQPAPRPEREPFPEKDQRKKDGDENAQLVDGYDDADLPLPDGIIVTQPGGARRNARKEQKHKFPAPQRPNAARLSPCKHDQPRHDEHHAGADGRRRVGIDVFNADLCQNGGGGGKDGGEQGKDKPHPLFPLFAPPDVRHQKGPRGDHGKKDEFEPPERPLVFKQADRKEHGQNGAGFVHGGHFGNFPHREGLEIADPRGARGEPRENEKNPGTGADRRKSGISAREKDDRPGKEQDDGSADRGCRVRIGGFHAAFG